MSAGSETAPSWPLTPALQDSCPCLACHLPKLQPLEVPEASLYKSSPILSPFMHMGGVLPLWFLSLAHKARLGVAAENFRSTCPGPLSLNLATASVSLPVQGLHPMSSNYYSVVNYLKLSSLTR